MATKVIFLALILFTTTFFHETATAESVATLTAQCADKLQNVMPCLSFANGKADKPTEQCCRSTESMKESNPACLCFVIQQIHNGTNPALKSLGIQEDRLLQLPSACKIVNASISNCPRLLDLPPNSPDAAIFSSHPPTTSTPAQGGIASPSGSTSSIPKSSGFKLGVSEQFAGSILVPLVLVFFYAFPHLSSILLE